MQSTKSIRVLESLIDDVKEIRRDINQIKIDQAQNKEVNELKTQVHVLETKIWILYVIAGAFGVESIAFLGYLIKQWVEK